MAIVTVHLMGGLGNQLFQIAAAYAYARRHGCELVFLKTWQSPQDRLPIWDTYLDSTNWNFVDSTENFSLLSEKGFSFSELPPGSFKVKLFGYFQSSRYFYECANEIRERLQIPKMYLELYPIPRNHTYSYIGAHVRRGDYVTKSEYHLSCTKKYYTSARQIIGQLPVYWITDDPDWVRENLEVLGDKVFSGDTIQDFTRLSQFKHLILSNSSFSWWAAWLNPLGHADRTICCPNRWFGPKGPQDYQDVYEVGWIQVDTVTGMSV